VSTTDASQGAQGRLALSADAALPRQGDGTDWVTHAILLLGVVLFALPIWIVLMGSTHDAATIGRGEVPLLPGSHALENYREAWERGGAGVPVGRMLWNSTVMALAIAVGKIAISIISAFAVVFFRFPFRNLAFWSIFITLMLPVEVRIFPTFKVVSDLGLVNTYGG
jgi:sn-glycerol 3-phosphate transport system permease protein